MRETEKLIEYGKIYLQDLATDAILGIKEEKRGPDSKIYLGRKLWSYINVERAKLVQFGLEEDARIYDESINKILGDEKLEFVGPLGNVRKGSFKDMVKFYEEARK